MKSGKVKSRIYISGTGKSFNAVINGGSKIMVKLPIIDAEKIGSDIVFYNNRIELDKSRSWEYHYIYAPIGTEVLDAKSGKIIEFVSKSKDGFCQKVVEVDSNVHLTGLGHRLLTNKKKVGRWVYLSKGGKQDSTVLYSTPYIVELLNPDKHPKTTKFEVKKDGIWMMSDYIMEKHSSASIARLKFFVTAGTDSCRYTSDSKIASAALNLEYKFDDDLISRMYLVSEGEDFIYCEGTKVPIMFSNSQYAIVWNDEAFKNQDSTNIKSRQTALIDLQRKYPSLLFSPMWNYRPSVKKDGTYEGIDSWIAKGKLRDYASKKPFDLKRFGRTKQKKKNGVSLGRIKLDISKVPIAERDSILKEISSLKYIYNLSSLVKVSGDSHSLYLGKGFEIKFKATLTPDQIPGIVSSDGFDDFEIRKYFKGNFIYGCKLKGNIMDRRVYLTLAKMSEHPSVQLIEVAANSIPHFFISPKEASRRKEKGLTLRVYGEHY